jgi:intein/homing endonuclease
MQYAKGLVLPKDLDEQHYVSWQKYGRFIKALPKVTAPTWDCRTLGIVGPIKDQGQCGCHVGTDEVLTTKGWKKWENYDWQTPIGTMNQETGLLEFQAPLQQHIYDYDGPLYYSDNRSVDFALTPNHRMYVRKWNESKRKLDDDYTFTEISKIGWYAGLPHATTGFLGTELKKLGVGNREYAGDDFLALIALLLSDGWAGGSESTKNMVSFCCFRDDRIEMVKELAHRLGIKESSRSGVWNITDGNLAEWFRKNAYTGYTYKSPFKRVPDLVKVASSRQISHFLKFFGDQHVEKEGTRRFYSSSKLMIDDLQELLLRVGKRGTIEQRASRPATFPDGHHVKSNNTEFTLTERRSKKLSLDRKKHIKIDHYKGKVYCATVPNSTLVTRRNGTVLVSGNSCFPAGTLVRMADGADKPIEQVTATDRVLTAEGNIHRVSHTMRRHAKEPLLTLVAWGHYHLRATAEHPIFTKRGYVKLGDLQPGDWVGFPKYIPETTSIIQTDDLLFERNTAKHSKHVYRNKCTQHVAIKTGIPDIIHLTHSFGRLVGLFLAEGSTSKTYTTWCFNILEKNTLAAEVVAILENELDIHPKIIECPKQSVVRVTVYGSRLSELFEKLCSHGAGAKRLHFELASGPRDFLEGVLLGWMDGDKHQDGSAVSISRKLALSMFNIANALGKLPCLSTHQKGKLGKDGIFREHAWQVSTNDPQIYKRGAATQDDKHMWRKVCEVTEEPFEGDVFNLEVEEDHSYVAEGCGVHNCWDFSGTGCCEMAMVKAGLGPAATFQLSEQYTLDCGQNGGCGGDDNSTVCDWCKKTGLPLTSEYGPYQGSAGSCKSGSHTMYKITDWGYCTNSSGVADTQAIKNAMVSYGPIGAAIAADDAFMNNPAGTVFQGSGSSDIDHDIILIGWDDSKGAWLLRNSWSASWCDSGYCFIKYGANQVGYAALWVTLPPQTIGWLV